MLYKIKCQRKLGMRESCAGYRLGLIYSRMYNTLTKDSMEIII